MESNALYYVTGRSHNDDIDVEGQASIPCCEPSRPPEPREFSYQPSTQTFRPTKSGRRMHRWATGGVSSNNYDERYGKDMETRHDEHRLAAKPGITHIRRNHLKDQGQDGDLGISGLFKGALKLVIVFFTHERGIRSVHEQRIGPDQPSGHSESKPEVHEVTTPSRDPEQALKESHEENRELLKQVSSLEETCQSLKRRNFALQMMRDSREELFGRQEPDDIIFAQFYNIFSQIRAWTSRFCREATRPLDVGHIEEGPIKLVSRVMPGVQSLEDLQTALQPGNIRRRRRFVRGWIALNVVETIFRSPPAPGHFVAAGSDMWLSNGPRDAIRTLESTLLQTGDSTTQYAFQEWRALTFCLLHGKYSSTHFPSDSLLLMKEEVHRTVNLIQSLSPPNTNLAEQEDYLLDNVFIPAVELSRVLRRQRASWSIRFPYFTTMNDPAQNNDGGRPVFNSDSMTDTDDRFHDDGEDLVSRQRLKIVGIVITPGLFKRGNHDGEHFDIEFPVEKTEVACRKVQQ